MSLRNLLFILSICLSFSFDASYGAEDELSNKEESVLPNGGEDALLESYSKNATSAIPRAYVLYKKKVWREIYLDEKQNRPCFMRDKEISKVIIDGVKKGLLVPYKDDKLVEVMPMSAFLKNLLMDESEDASQDTTGHEFYGHDISTLCLVENVIFNKISSKKEYDIESIQLIVPSKKNYPFFQLDRPIATFKYKDLLAYFNKLPLEEVCWCNPSNTAETLTWMDAFSLRLFGGKIIKIETLDDANLDALYQDSYTKEIGPDASQKIAEKIDVEFEYLLYEY
ncbi:gliding motility protein GldN [Cardinium endosymbiont of Culicoides punctatus]|uniref:type IX secretion system ring protein PorN/GldN n=1 Tax=Cardinium endosymbiont of Culicoides punctatus TaxID=2304601 RepID=UPI0010585158|nr:gliding motility protein GldN [Cardinium endosymbiont of Culicoides punctatus]TDG95751.1 hypothetical protein CCPUN_00350 [Cardinium endosymbiont of Culicoides punctatus]